jgi:hypothetical protein
MTLVHCPRCQSIVVSDAHNTDVIHECTNEFSNALKNEDVVVYGDWYDYTGSGTEPSLSNQFRGQNDKLWGTRPWREGAPVLPDFTVRGNSKNIYRTRQHLEFIDMKKQPQR